MPRGDAREGRALLLPWTRLYKWDALGGLGRHFIVLFKIYYVQDASMPNNNRSPPSELFFSEVCQGLECVDRANPTSPDFFCTHTTKKARGNHRAARSSQAGSQPAPSDARCVKPGLLQGPSGMRDSVALDRKTEELLRRCDELLGTKSAGAKDTTADAEPRFEAVSEARKGAEVAAEKETGKEAEANDETIPSATSEAATFDGADERARAPAGAPARAPADVPPLSPPDAPALPPPDAVTPPAAVTPPEAPALPPPHAVTPPEAPALPPPDAVTPPEARPEARPLSASLEHTGAPPKGAAPEGGAPPAPSSPAQSPSTPPKKTPTDFYFLSPESSTQTPPATPDVTEDQLLTRYSDDPLVRDLLEQIALLQGALERCRRLCFSQKHQRTKQVVRRRKASPL